MRSLDELDTSKLSLKARETLSAVQRIENEGESREDVLAELGIDEAEYSRRMVELGSEWTIQGGTVEIPPLTTEEYAALRDSIAATGQRYPILRGPDGEIVDGTHRERICLELGIEPIYEDVAGTADELQSLALVLNLARRQLDSGARRGIIRDELLRDPSRSDRAVAAIVGVNHRTVATVRRDLEQNGQVEKLSTSRGRDGKTYPRAAAPRSQEETEQREQELPVGVIDVTLRIGKAVAKELDGGRWLTCKAVRLNLIDPGIYELELQT